MNQFDSIESGKGILKNDYKDSVSEALKRKREKLAETKLGLIKDDEDADSNMGS